jgi:hypothetical protein
MLKSPSKSLETGKGVGMKLFEMYQLSTMKGRTLSRPSPWLWQVTHSLDADSTARFSLKLLTSADFSCQTSPALATPATQFPTPLSQDTLRRIGKQTSF